MRPFVLAGLIVAALSGVAHAAAFTFNTAPFAGSTALTTPGRQVVGGEPFITFDLATDQFVFSQAAFDPFGFGPALALANAEIGAIPTSGANIIVLRTFDDDNDSATAFGAGNAANLIAARVTSPGAGFFIYFNSGLNLPRLVFSTNLDDNTSDLKIMARLTNFTGAAGQNQLANFNLSDFAVSTSPVPEPSALLLFSAAVVLATRRYRRQ